MEETFFSSRHLRREIKGIRPAYLLKRKLTRDEGSIFEEASWEMNF